MGSIVDSHNSRLCGLAIELKSPQHFWVERDVIVGQAILDVYADELKLRDIQLEIICDELLTVAKSSSSRQATIEANESQNAGDKKGDSLPPLGISGTRGQAPPDAVSQSKRRFELKKSLIEADLLSRGAHTLHKGHYRFDFSIALPETISLAAPDTPNASNNGLEVGVKWSLNARAYDMSAVLAEASEPLVVYPSHGAELPRNLSALGFLTSETEVEVDTKLRFKGLRFPGSVVLGYSTMDSIKSTFSVRLGYPRAGIAQGYQPSGFTLQLESSLGVVVVKALRVYLTQAVSVEVFENDVRFADVYHNYVELGSSYTPFEVDDQHQNFDSVVKDFALPYLISPPFKSDSLAVSYKLTLDMLVSSTAKKGTLETINLTVPVDVLEPSLFPERKHISAGNLQDRLPREHLDLEPPKYEDLAPRGTFVLQERKIV